MAGYPAGIGNAYVDPTLNYCFMNPTASVWPSAPGNINASGNGLSNLYLGLSSVAYDATTSATYSEPSTGGYARITIPTGSTNWQLYTSGTATFLLPSGSVAGNTGTYRYAQLRTNWQFPQNTASTNWVALYLILFDQPGVGVGNVVGFGPNPTASPNNIIAQNSIGTVSAGTTFQVGISR